MYVLRLAVELGQYDQDKWGGVQQQLLLAKPLKPVDLNGLHSTREDVHALLQPSRGGPLHGGVFSRLTESRGELMRLVEGGQARLARLNTILRVLWDKSTGVASVSSAERAGTLNDLVGVLIGESQLGPELALRLFSALGNDVVRRAKSGAEGVSPALARDVATLRLASKGVADERSQRAAIAATELCAVLRITEALAKTTNVPDELERRCAALQDELRARVKGCFRSKKPRQVANVLGAAEDLVAELPPDPSEHGPGNSLLDLMVHLLRVVTSG